MPAHVLRRPHKEIIRTGLDNPAQAAKVLAADMRLNMALSCRISVSTEKNETKIAKEVEEATMKMVDEAI